MCIRDSIRPTTSFYSTDRFFSLDPPPIRGELAEVVEMADARCRKRSLQIHSASAANAQRARPGFAVSGNDCNGPLARAVWRWLSVKEGYF
eukprot:7979066-Pyramimonas_sp.AAC.1